MFQRRGLAQILRMSLSLRPGPENLLGCGWALHPHHPYPLGSVIWNLCHRPVLQEPTGETGLALTQVLSPQPPHYNPLSLGWGNPWVPRESHLFKLLLSLALSPYLHLPNPLARTPIPPPQGRKVKRSLCRSPPHSHIPMR